MSRLQIRRYETQDQNRVIELSKVALQHAGAFAGDGAWNDDLNEIEEVYLKRGGEFLVGILDGSLVATGALKRTSEDRAEIKRMRVHPEVQRHGFGQAILEALERYARIRGYRHLHLDTTVEQQAAQQFYLKNGYHWIGEGKIGKFDVRYYEKSIP